jgi:hypothetical protein
MSKIVSWRRESRFHPSTLMKLSPNQSSLIHTSTADSPLLLLSLTLIHSLLTLGICWEISIHIPC